MSIEKIDWLKTPLLPVITQEASTKAVLMLAYMNEEALALTLQTRIVHYFSRTRQKIWQKGESSGHIQRLHAAYLDCDEDTLLLHVTQEGVACHTGRESCFFQRIDADEAVVAPQITPAYDIYDTLYHTVQERKHADPKSSYIASLIHKGENGYLKKVVEEAGEFAFACKDRDEKAIVYEAADLLFHTLVTLGIHAIHPERIADELKRRLGVSGIEEKRQRHE